jgi:hypothetical protein
LAPFQARGKQGKIIGEVVMSASFFRLALRTIAGAIAGSFIFVSAGSAQQISPDQFQANPGQVLTANPSAAQLTSAIRQLAIADSKDLPLIIDLLRNATPEQAAAIGAGLGQATLVLLRTNPTYAQQIQQALIMANNKDANDAYAAVTGNTQIGAAGGGGGSPGGVGGATNPLPGGTGGNGGTEGIGRGGVSVQTPGVTVTGSPTSTGGLTVSPNNGNASTINVIVSVSPSH